MDMWIQAANVNFSVVWNYLKEKKNERQRANEKERESERVIEIEKDKFWVAWEFRSKNGEGDGPESEDDITFFR